MASHRNFRNLGAISPQLRALGDLDGDGLADFIVGDDHVVVFANRIFRYRIGDDAGREEAVSWGRSVGTPDHQLDWGD